MANILSKTENTSPLGSDEIYLVDDPNGTPADNRIYLGNLNLLPDGLMINGKLNVTVASNNITLALKTKSAGNPSATDPVSIWINGTMRQVTAALSVTKNAGTDWAALGSILPAAETDLFVYLIWNTGPATDIVDIGFSRYAHGRLYSDFSGTTTNQGYLAYGNATPPAATDALVNVGRFAATLSAGAGYTWSVPAFTNTNLIHVPTYETRILTYTPTVAGFSANPTAAYRYFVRGKNVTVRSVQSANGTSNATTFTITSPFTSLASAGQFWAAPGYGPVDNGAAQTAAAFASLAQAASTINVWKNADGGTTAWTNTNGKRVAYFELTFPIAE